MKSEPGKTIPIRSLRELIHRYEDRLSILEIERVILESGQVFTGRGVHGEEALQAAFLKRCHTALLGSLLLLQCGSAQRV